MSLSLLRLRIRSALYFSSRIYQQHRQVSSLPHPTPISAADVPFPLPRDPSSPPLVAPPKLECCTTQLNTRVKLMIKMLNLDYAAELSRYAVFTKSRQNVTVEICEAIINAMCKAKRYNDALHHFHYFFNDYNLKPNISCCNHIIGALCDQHRLDDAFALYGHILENASFLRPNEETHQLLAKGLIDADKLQSALHFVRRLMNKEDDVGSSVLNHLIRGHLKDGDFTSAKRIFDILKLKRVSSTDAQVFDLVYSFLGGDYNEIAIVKATFMEFWFEKGDDKEAMECYMTLAPKDFRMNAKTGNTLLQLFLKYGKRTEAWTLFYQMLERRNEQPSRFDSETCNIMVNECFKLGEISEAIKTFDKVKTVEDDESQLCYANILARLCEQGMLPEAETYFAEMLQDSTMPSECWTEQWKQN
ncbi:PREDICTED: pentatricopeptide repeat-containing protein At1g10270-like [Camelina sativa]|uniref:Pentatricopeptide repeat-containing protein At1g10270-like n=1 Tax=Camelina sativa TaxID=90675 RepID=A0ABM0SZZ4_CAMSA|nr:PREDICTED: pentatricopeptide repeat-containing protein At1g10270-like [Camelina sativa]